MRHTRTVMQLVVLLLVATGMISGLVLVVTPHADKTNWLFAAAMLGTMIELVYATCHRHDGSGHIDLLIQATGLKLSGNGRSMAANDHHVQSCRQLFKPPCSFPD